MPGPVFKFLETWGQKIGGESSKLSQKGEQDRYSFFKFESFFKSKFCVTRPHLNEYLNGEAQPDTHLGEGVAGQTK